VFVQDLQESFWGDFQGRTQETLKRLLEGDAEQQMGNYLALPNNPLSRSAAEPHYQHSSREASGKKSHWI